MPSMTIEIDSAEDQHALRVRCAGDVLFGRCPQLWRELERWEAADVRDLVLDCRSVRFLDSSAIPSLNGAARFAAAHGWSFGVRPSPEVERVLRAAGRADLLRRDA
jgi:anti-anti-sigma factor